MKLVPIFIEEKANLPTVKESTEGEDEGFVKGPWQKYNFFLFYSPRKELKIYFTPLKDGRVSCNS